MFILAGFEKACVMRKGNTNGLIAAGFTKNEAMTILLKEIE